MNTKSKYLTADLKPLILQANEVKNKISILDEMNFFIAEMETLNAALRELRDKLAEIKCL